MQPLNAFGTSTLATCATLLVALATVTARVAGTEVRALSLFTFPDLARPWSLARALKACQDFPPAHLSTVVNAQLCVAASCHLKSCCCRGRSFQCAPYKGCCVGIAYGAMCL